MPLAPRSPRPRIAVPAHGEPLHLSEHAAFAKAQGVPQVLHAFDGDLVCLAPGDVSTIGKVDRGRRLKDGAILLPADQECVGQRRRLSFAGIVSIALDFRSGNTDPYPASVQDINYAVRWAKANARMLKTKPELVGLSGQSSGGHLAMLVAMRKQFRFPHAVLIVPIFRLAKETHRRAAARPPVMQLGTPTPR